MPGEQALEYFRATLKEIRAAGLYKDERIITTPQGVAIRVQGGAEVLNFCAKDFPRFDYLYHCSFS